MGQQSADPLPCFQFHIVTLLTKLDKPISVAEYQLVRAQPEPLDTNLPSIEEIEAELCEGADEVVRHWMRKLRTRRIALLSAPTAREGWTTFDHQGTAENGWQIYTGDLDGRPQTMKLCPNFALYYPATPKQLHFTARKAKDIPPHPNPNPNPPHET